MSKLISYHHYLPHHLISRLIAVLCYCRWRWFKNWSIQRFIRIYGVDLSESESEKLEDFIHLNAFFTRTIRPELRPIVSHEAAIACPVDGYISQQGVIEGNQLLQAKGHHYSLEALLAHNDATVFQNGHFMTLYLAPHNYHRIHMPFSGQLKSMVYVPGRLFSVNQISAQKIPSLFARNERVICTFDTQVGPMAVILVGAMIVGSMETVWAGRITPNRFNQIQTWHYPDSGERAVSLVRGAELGRFNFGSTVIILFSADAISWHDKCQIDATMRFGELLGQIKQNGTAH